MLQNNKKQNGVTLIEVVVCVAIFAILSVSVYGVFTSIINGIVYYRERTTISSLADQYLEVVRNMPYSQVGTIEGNPHGALVDLPNPINLPVNGINYQIYYAVSYVDDSADGTALAGTDPSPNDYKQIKLYIKNSGTGTLNSFLTNVSPKGLEGMIAGGALHVLVFDAVGQPVPNATIHIQNSKIIPNIDLTRLSDSNGIWTEVGLAPSALGYHITVTKTGYSSDQTYASSVQNPNPVKPDETILAGQITGVSFSVDKLSNLVLNTLDQNCAPVSAVSLGARGAKLIGTAPNVFKFNNSYTSNDDGRAYLNNIEWDTYTPGIASDSYMVYGSSPIQQINILPGTNQNFNLILGPKTTNSLLAIVKDASTGNPIEAAKVELQEGSSDITEYTNGSVWSQQSWLGGPGQEDFSDVTKYYQDDGNVSVNNIPTGLRLSKIGESYVANGSLTSSTFDTGTSSTHYTTLTWQPTSQDPATGVKFQIASNNDKVSWNYVGPDGTGATYYTVPGTTINNADNNRYIRYKVFLSSTNSARTPVLTSVGISYVIGCAAPGQAMFPDLQKADDYRATISMDGYQTLTLQNIKIDGYGLLPVLLGH